MNNPKLLKGLVWSTLITIAVFLLTPCKSIEAKELPKVEKWGVYKMTLKGSPDGNPYMANTLNATFSNKKTTIKVPGFYDGDGVYKIRFSPDHTGEWSYQTESNVPELNNKKGKLLCINPTGNNHGPVQPANTHYLKYADGSPFYSVSTTAYQWTSDVLDTWNMNIVSQGKVTSENSIS